MAGYQQNCRRTDLQFNGLVMLLFGRSFKKPFWDIVKEWVADYDSCGYRTLDRPPTIFGKSLWDVDPYAYLALRIKSDGRKYFVNVQTESIVPTDLHQHRLYSRKTGEWETVLIKWNEFVRTNHGVVIEPQTELLRYVRTSMVRSLRAGRCIKNMEQSANNG
jgi:hypothetical protein